MAGDIWVIAQRYSIYCMHNVICRVALSAYYRCEISSPCSFGGRSHGRPMVGQYRFTRTIDYEAYINTISVRDCLKKRSFDE